MVTTAIILDQRRVKKNGKYPVKLRVTYNGKQKYYAVVGNDLSPTDFDLVKTSRPKGDFKDLSLKFSSIERKAKLTIDKLDKFSFVEFEKNYLEEKNGKKKSAYQLFEERIVRLKEDGRIGTAISYENTLHSLQIFIRHLSWELITKEFLTSYEHWMINKGKSKTTVGIVSTPFLRQ